MAGAGNTLMTIAAGEQAGGAGLALFGLDDSGSIWCIWQETPGGAWSAWDGPKFQGQPGAAARIAVAGQNDGALLLAMLDNEGFVWTCAQDGPSGTWGEWQGPGISGQVFSWEGIAAGENDGQCGTQIWATDSQAELWTLWQTTPGGSWTPWYGPGSNGQTFKCFGCCAAGQNNGALALFAMDADSLVWVALQDGPSGNWSAWDGPGFDAQQVPLDAICAARQGGNRGVQFWGLDESGQAWTIWQDTPGGFWDGWQGPGFASQPATFTQLAAAGQNNGCTLLAGLDPTGALWTIGQTAPGGDWGEWAELGVPG